MTTTEPDLAAEFPLYEVVERYHEAETYREHVDALAAAGEITRHAAEMTEAAVIEARRDGLRWREIGAALGVSGQAVWQRHHAKADAAIDHTADDIVEKARTCGDPGTVHQWDSAGKCTTCGVDAFAGLPS